MRKRWLILGVLYLCSLSFAFTFQSVPPVLNLVMNELGLSHTEGGLLMSFFALPGILMSIPAGMLADRFSQKAIAITSLTLIIAGTAVFTLGSSLPVLIAGRVLSGIGGVTLVVTNPRMLVQWFTGYEIGTALGIYITAMPLGTIISLSSISVLAENIGWRISLGITVVVFLIALTAFALLYTQPPNQERKSSTESIREGMKHTGLPVWLCGIIWLLFNASIISFFTFTPDFLATSGFSIASAGLLTGLSMLPAFVTSPAIGYLIDKIDYKRTIMAVCAFGTAVTIALIPNFISQILLLTLILGVFQNGLVTPLYALVSELSGARRLGLGYGILATCLNIGVLIGPAVVGLAKDLTATYTASYWLMSLFALAIIVVVFLIKRDKGKAVSR